MGSRSAVHTTQFAIRAPQNGLFRPLLELAAEEMDRADRRRAEPVVRIAGVCGPTATGAGRGRIGAGVRLPRWAVEPGWAEERLREGSDRPLPAGRRGASPGRLLPATGGGRAGAALLLLAPAGGDRRLGSDQDRPLQPLPDPGRGAGDRRGRARRRGPVHGQRRQHRPGPADPLSLPELRRESGAAHRRRFAGAVGRLDAQGGGVGERVPQSGPSAAGTYRPSCCDCTSS